MIDIISREDSKLKKFIYYYTGIVCKNGHLDKRYVNTGICYSCKRNQSKKDYYNHKQRIINTNKKSQLKNKDQVKLTKNNWVKNNREKSNNIKKKYKQIHRDKYLEYCRNYSKNIRKNPFKRLSCNISKAIWECLKENKNRRRWELVVGYTIEDLKSHLESKFTNEMNWNNYGQYWHLDHIKPLSWFDLETEFNDAWNINNLQPLEASKNLSKRDRYIG